MNIDEAQSNISSKSACWLKPQCISVFWSRQIALNFAVAFVLTMSKIIFPLAIRGLNSSHCRVTLWFIHCTQLAETPE